MRAIGSILLCVAVGDAWVHQAADPFTVALMLLGGAALWYGRRVRRGGRPWF
jgi:hypothetical protein